ncbi:lipid particle protein [Stachybotrys elegans]|uniref:Lipid particle protein n=1 Tax=Stachybotrys elegans TaxID=80388 RepID=A0A8K0SY18_9HYPO|nr:lipid particle protein [Stachybotrys elegans]
MDEYIGGTTKADHLCVLVHGLWGEPKHMTNVAKFLRQSHSADELYLLIAERNTGNNTYDGIERGGERVCAEIEEELQKIEGKGGKITKLSVVGYSMGGLVARYAVGLLDARGVLDSVECMNFTTFATPHLGARSPAKGMQGHIFNVLAARTLSMSGRQMFIIDSFRDTGRPLLSIMVDDNSIFMNGLRKFKRHSLYSNVVGDEIAPYYTTCISRTNPYVDTNKIKVNYLKGQEDVIIDYANALVSDYKPGPPPPRWTLERIRFLVLISIFIPIGVTIFLGMALVQSFRSASRIRLHEAGRGGVKVEDYRMPFMINELREGVEHAYEALNNAKPQQFLGSRSDQAIDLEERQVKGDKAQGSSGHPTLALAEAQFQMIDELDKLNWRKYPVWIHNERRSHAAIIVRMDKPSYDEGRLILKHFSEQEFLTR